MSVIKKLASQTAVYGLSTMLGRFLNFLLVPLYLSKLSGAADYGIVSVMFTYASFMAILFALGLETAFFHFSKKTGQPGKVLATATHTLIITGFTAVLISRLFGFEIMEWIGYPQFPQFASYFALILAADAITSLGFAWLRQQEKPWSFAWIRLTNIGINIAANLFFLVVCPWLGNYLTSPEYGCDSKWLDLGVWCIDQSRSSNMISNIFMSNLLASLITLPLLWKTWTNLKWGLNVELLKSMLRYSLPLVVVGLAGMINETLDRVLLKELLPADLGDAEAGMYSAFYKLSLVLTLFVQAFRFAAEPFFFGKSNDKDAPETYALVMRYFVYVSGGIFLVTMICIPWLAPLLLQKPLYYENARGLKIVPVLLLANLCLGIYYNLSIWYKLSGKTQMGGLIALFGAIVTIFGNFIFIPKFGFVASAYTTLGAYATLVVLGYWFGQKYYPIPYPLGIIFLILILAILPIVVLPTVFPMIHHAYYWALLPLYLGVVFAIEKRLSRTPLNQS